MPRPGSTAESYDAVIVGAGIAGLVCGCRLAKMGMKVLMAERHHKPGGYCTSFKRRGFTFDAAAHSFGGYREGGNVRKVFSDLGVDRLINIRRYDPSDVILAPGCRISFRSDRDETIDELQRAFPGESGSIRSFLLFLVAAEPQSFARMRSRSFSDLLDSYFKDKKLKTVLSFPVLGNGGLPPSLMSAFVGSRILSEFLLDGGYYPEDGMQALSDALAERFRTEGGRLLLSCEVKKIKTSGGRVTGVVLSQGGHIESGRVIANCDSRQTFLRLLDERPADRSFLSRLTSMEPSLSMFILYLGLDLPSGNPLLAPGTNLWLLSDYDLEKTYLSVKKLQFKNACTMMRSMPDENVLLAFMNAPFSTRKYWDANREDLATSLIQRIEKSAFPGLSSHIRHRETATPHTLQRFTLNYKGAAYGWAATPSQLALLEMRRPRFVKGLYLAGHWTTQGLGIPGAVYSGYDTAGQVARKL